MAASEPSGRAVVSVTAEAAHAYVEGLEEAYRGDRPSADPSIAVVDGEGVSVKVKSGHLVVSDGEGWLRRERAYNRATSELRRLVITAGSGVLTLDALFWCREAGVAVVVLDSDEVVLAQGPASRVDARVLRVQASPPDGLAVEAARLMLGAKLRGQARVARNLLGDERAASTVLDQVEAMGSASSIDECRQLEATAANAYFAAWEGHPATTMRFARSDAKKVPAHWAGFSGRRSPLTNGNYNRRAATPLNACLNYLYKVAAVEVRLALVKIGLHPSLGFVHSDEAKRENLVWDVLETVRPDVDTWALGLLDERAFKRVDFRERYDGSVAIAPALCHDLAGTMPLWGKAVAPHVEGLYHLLGRAVEGKWTPSTPLTRTRNRAAAAQVMARKGFGVPRERRGKSVALFRTCEGCGGALDGGMSLRPSRQQLCSACCEQVPNQTVEVRAKRGHAIARQRAEMERWRAEGVRDAVTLEEVEKALEGATLPRIMAACGVSKATASGWRAGKQRPPERHWAALASMDG